jgi:hypothetical protein
VLKRRFGWRVGALGGIGLSSFALVRIEHGERSNQVAAVDSLELVSQSGRK